MVSSLFFFLLRIKSKVNHEFDGFIREFKPDFENVCGILKWCFSDRNFTKSEIEKKKWSNNPK